MLVATISSSNEKPREWFAERVRAEFGKSNFIPNCSLKECAKSLRFEFLKPLAIEELLLQFGSPKGAGYGHHFNLPVIIGADEIYDVCRTRLSLEIERHQSIRGCQRDVAGK